MSKLVLFVFDSIIHILINLTLFKRVGMFVLTPDSGMKEIGDCKMSGFHPHTKNPPLFEVSFYKEK